MTEPSMTDLLRRVLLCAVSITVVLGLASFTLSFAALWDLATMAGIPRSLSWMWPVIVDGTILQATISVIALASYPDQVRGRRFFWAVLVVAATVSVAANAVHAFASGAGTVAPALSAAMATVAPLSLLAATHGLSILMRVQRPEPVIAVRTIEPVLVEAEPEPGPVEPELDIHAEVVRLRRSGLSSAEVAARLDVPKSIVDRIPTTQARPEPVLVG